MGRWNLDKTRYPGVFRRDDGRLVVRVGVVSERTGKPVERSKVMPEGATLAEARQVAEDLRKEARNPIVAVKMPSLSAYLETWMKRKILRGDWTNGASTQAQVERIFRLHIKPKFGDYLLNKITPRDLQEWMDEQLETSGKRSSIRTRWIPLKNMLADASAEFGFPNPCSRIKPPKGSSVIRGGKDLVLMPEQVRQYIEAAKEESPDTWYPVLILGFGSGARPSEILAVQVGDLDLSDKIGIWKVSRHIVGTNVIEGTKQHIEGRTIYLDPITTEILRPRWEERKEESPEAFLFPGRYERCLTQHGLWLWFQKAAKKFNLPEVSAKTFRQTYITLAALNNVSAALTMEQTGHNSLQVHAIYQRVPSEPRKQAAETMGNVISLTERREKMG